MAFALARRRSPKWLRGSSQRSGQPTFLAEGCERQDARADWTDSPAVPQFELHDRALKGSPYEREHFVPKPCACSGRGLFTGVMDEIITWSIQGCKNMETIESKVTSQGQVSVPAPVRQKLGLAPGSRIEWREKGEEVVVRKASKYSSRDIHKAVFATPQDPVDVAGMDAGIRSRIRREHAGR